MNLEDLKVKHYFLKYHFRFIWKQAFGHNMFNMEAQASQAHQLIQSVPRTPEGKFRAEQKYS